MTTANLLRTLLMPIIVFLGVISLTLVIWLVVTFPSFVYLRFHGGVIISKHLMTRDKLED